MQSTPNTANSESPNHFHASLACIECGTVYDLHSVRYRCDCGGLLEVRHDVAALKRKTGEEWKALFESRYRSCEHPFDSGVWGKKEWVLPGIDNRHIVTLGEGATPLVRMDRLAAELGVADLRVKQSGVSHTGSFKDLGMTVLVSHVLSLKAKGHSIRAVAAASSGDTSAALAAYGAAAGVPTIVFLPAGKVSTAQLVQPLSNGALVLSLNTDFDGCMRIVKEVTAREGIYLANSMNPLRIEGQKTISVEISQQMGWEIPDWIVIPGGNLGNVSALASGFRLMKETGMIRKTPRLALAQAANANPMYRSYLKNFESYEPVQATKTQASAIQIGDPVSYPRAVRALREFGGVVEDATEDELSNASAFADRFGLFNDPHTGVALAGLNKLIKRKVIEPHHRVVVVSTAHGLKFSEFKTGYHKDDLDGVKSLHRNEPEILEPSVDAVLKAIERRLG